ncbi:MAG: PrsW family glutamic-type intramembrane protease, partial [Minisyncoccia bacterium]
IGFAFAFSDESHPAVRVAAGAAGLILAVALHTTFNALIMSQGTSSALFTAIFLIWIAAVIFFAVFEVLKFFQYQHSPANPYTL